MTRDPNSYIQASADALAETLLSKNSDYAPTGEFSNFEQSAKVAGITVAQLITAQIAIKMTRIQTLLEAASASNEPLKDSFLDLAGYAAIGHAWLESRAPEAERIDLIDDRETIRNVLDETVSSDREILNGLADDDYEPINCNGYKYHVWRRSAPQGPDYCAECGKVEVHDGEPGPLVHRRV